MVDALDMLQCPVCATFYAPETISTGRLIPHCVLPAYAPHENLSLGQLTEYRWLDGMTYVDFEAIERRVLAGYGLTDVVGPPLTGQLLDIEV